jgi:nitroimidazol reductase NimA-like FMN-containing flavoprotein (pyridoxamine 5'-phosphate oxidase superfamily)
MIGDRMTQRTEPADFTRDDCLHLLGTGELGRVVFTASAMPAVQPVRYVLHGEEVVFRVADAGSLSTATQYAVVGFQVDDIDPITHAGWSILGVGQAYQISDADRRSVPVAGSATHTVVVPLQQLTGQRIRLGHIDAGAAARPAVAARTVSC